jgi:hypothetical protein
MLSPDCPRSVRSEAEGKCDETYGCKTRRSPQLPQCVAYILLQELAVSPRFRSHWENGAAFPDSRPVPRHRLR